MQFKRIRNAGQNQLLPVAADDGIGQVQNLVRAFRDDFPGGVLSAENWTVVSSAAGAPTVSASVLSIVANTTTNVETTLRSNEAFTFPFRAQFLFNLTARDANREVYFEVVDETGTQVARFLIDGTTATTFKTDCVNGGTAMGPVSNTGWLTSASNSLLEIETGPDDIKFGQRVVNSGNSRSNTALCQQRIPDPNALYYVQIRVKNLGTAPAAATLNVDHVAVQDINEIAVDIVSARGASTNAEALTVLIGGNTPSASATSTMQTPSATGGGYSTTHVISGGSSAATTNATSVKASAANVGSIEAVNNSASWRYLKLYNKASAPTVGTDTPVRVIGMPPASSRQIEFPAGLRLTAGLAYAITAGIANTDATAIGAGECAVSIDYL